MAAFGSSAPRFIAPRAATEVGPGSYDPKIPEAEHGNPMIAKAPREPSYLAASLAAQSAKAERQERQERPSDAPAPHILRPALAVIGPATPPQDAKRDQALLVTARMTAKGDMRKALVSLERKVARRDEQLGVLSSAYEALDADLAGKSAVAIEIHAVVQETNALRQQLAAASANTQAETAEREEHLSALLERLCELQSQAAEAQGQAAAAALSLAIARGAVDAATSRADSQSEQLSTLAAGLVAAQQGWNASVSEATALKDASSGLVAHAAGLESRLAKVTADRGLAIAALDQCHRRGASADAALAVSDAALATMTAQCAAMTAAAAAKDQRIARLTQQCALATAAADMATRQLAASAAQRADADAAADAAADALVDHNVALQARIAAQEQLTQRRAADHALALGAIDVLRARTSAAESSFEALFAHLEAVQADSAAAAARIRTLETQNALALGALAHAQRRTASLEAALADSYDAAQSVLAEAMAEAGAEVDAARSEVQTLAAVLEAKEIALEGFACAAAKGEEYAGELAAELKVTRAQAAELEALQGKVGPLAAALATIRVKLCTANAQLAIATADSGVFAVSPSKVRGGVDDAVVALAATADKMAAAVEARLLMSPRRAEMGSTPRRAIDSAASAAARVSAALSPFAGHVQAVFGARAAQVARLRADRDAEAATVAELRASVAAAERAQGALRGQVAIALARAKAQFDITRGLEADLSAAAARETSAKAIAADFAEAAKALMAKLEASEGRMAETLCIVDELRGMRDAAEAAHAAQGESQAEAIETLMTAKRAAQQQLRDATAAGYALVAKARAAFSASDSSCCEDECDAPWAAALDELLSSAAAALATAEAALATESVAAAHAQASLHRTEHELAAALEQSLARMARDEAEVARHQTEVARYQAAADAARAAHDTLKANVNSMVRSAAAAQRASDAAQLDDVNAVADALQNTLNAMQVALDEAAEDKAAAAIALEDAERRAAASEAAVTGLESELVAALEAGALAREQAQTAGAERDGLATALADARTQFARFEASLEEEVASRAAQLSTAVAAAADMQCQLSVALARADQAEAARAALEDTTIAEAVVRGWLEAIATGVGAGFDADSVTEQVAIELAQEVAAVTAEAAAAAAEAEGAKAAAVETAALLATSQSRLAEATVKYDSGVRQLSERFESQLATARGETEAMADLVEEERSRSAAVVAELAAAEQSFIELYNMIRGEPPASAIDVEAVVRAKDQAEAEVASLASANSKLVGHNNKQQRIHYLEKVSLENRELKRENLSLKSQVSGQQRKMLQMQGVKALSASIGPLTASLSSSVSAVASARKSMVGVGRERELERPRSPLSPKNFRA